MEKTCTCGSCKEPCAKNISIFSTLSNEELLKIVNMTEHKSFKENDVLCREGEKSDKLFLIREGRVKICKITKEGKEQIVYVLCKAMYFKKREFRKNTNKKSRDIIKNNTRDGR